MPEEKKIEYVVSTLSIEHLAPSDDAIRMCREMNRGNINMEEALSRVLAYHGLKGKTSNV